jgi:hypothetical protein
VSYTVTSDKLFETANSANLEVARRHKYKKPLHLLQSDNKKYKLKSFNSTVEYEKIDKMTPFSAALLRHRLDSLSSAAWSFASSLGFLSLLAVAPC